MRDQERARAALECAQDAEDEITRSLWLAKAADYAIHARAVLVGGAAVNLYTGSYKPTDVDMCAYLDHKDRESLNELGFRQSQGDHFDIKLEGGDIWLLEFPSSLVDGETSVVSLDFNENLDVISLESLIVDRIEQATDRTTVTFDEALRLCVSVFEQANWNWVENELQKRSELNPTLGLTEMYERVLAETQILIAGR